MRLQQGDAARANLYVRAFRLFVQLLFRLFFRVRVIGLKNVPRKPVIVCANHLGWADPFLILSFLPVEPRIYVLGLHLAYLPDQGAQAFRTRVINSLELMVPLDVNRPLEALRTMKDVLKRGGSLLIFPEGNYVGAEEGKLQELQDGASHVSLTTGAPLLPVGLIGTRELWLRRRITMRVGRPIYPDQFEGDLRTRMHAMTERLAAELKALIARGPRERPERPKLKLLRNWLTYLFYEEFDRPEGNVKRET